MTTINGHQYDYNFERRVLWIAGSAILVPPQTQSWQKNIRIREKSVYTANYPDSKVFGFKVPTLDYGFKISGGMTTETGMFSFRIRSRV